MPVGKKSSFGTHSGKYRIKKPDKYLGDPGTVQYRSSWERLAFLWCERNDDVVGWSSEEVVVPYLCATDKRPHRYFIDLYVEWKDGTKSIIEIKPSVQTKKPRKGKSRKRYLREVATYAKNKSKWNAAEAYASSRGWKFEIWTEKELKAKGIKKW